MVSFADKATNPARRDEDWEAIMSFCDRVNKELEGPQISVRLLAHKIQSPQEREALFALAVSCSEREGTVDMLRSALLRYGSVEEREDFIQAECHKPKIAESELQILLSKKGLSDNFISPTDPGSLCEELREEVSSGNRQIPLPQ